jgi:hypothetical protein
LQALRAASRRVKQPLFEKSGAKTSLTLGHGLWRRQSPAPAQKVFLVLFLQKKNCLPYFLGILFHASSAAIL